MVDELAHGDGFAVFGKLGDPFPYVVVLRELALLDEQGRRGGGELLRHRADDERRCRRDGDVVLDVRPPVALGEEDAAVLVDAHGAAGRP